MDNQAFIQHCRAQLAVVFEKSKSGRPDSTLKHRVEGMLQAAELLNILSRDDAQQLIETVHVEVFGETTEARADRKRRLQELKETDPDEYFATPAIERR
ncbi:hypothetical protein [Alteromonas facilis]|uniref:hypothetical protein n=1 Tax=Alteromonas facilis TaxID=2048004 RepID=UPI000C28D70D|nr:hypothetical protein [Alteromonas facilis]